MMGQTADISAICQFEWFQWVMYYEPTETYPNIKWTMGRYLGPSLDVGTAMTQKILKANGEFVIRKINHIELSFIFSAGEILQRQFFLFLGRMVQ